MGVECPSDFGAKKTRKKLKEIIIISYIQKLCITQGFLFLYGGSICKNFAALFTFWNIYGIITWGSYLLDKLEFVGENGENLIYDWRYYGGWKNNCVPTA